MSFSSKPTNVLSYALIFALLFNIVGVPSALASAGVPQPTAQKSKLTADIGDLPNKLPKSSIELPSKRTKNSTTYLNPNGSFTEKVFADAQFYQDPADKKLKPIDNSLASSGKNPGKVENKANDFTALFGTQTTAGDSLVTVQKDGKSISMNPIGSNSSQGTVSGNMVNYKNIFADTTLQYTVQGNTVKEDLILSKFSNRNVFSFELKLNGLTPAVDNNGLISFSDGAGKKFMFEKPYMVDANGKRSDNVSLKLRTENGKTYVDVIADPQFLQDPATQYPLTIDPTITDWQVQRDNFVSSAFPTSIFSSNTYLDTGYNSYFGSTRSLVKFYLPALPSASKIQSAQFGAYQTVQSGTNTSIDLYRATSAWSSSVTWNTQPTIGTTPESTTTNNTNNAYWTWDATQLAKDWYNGSLVNNGLMLKQQNEGSSAIRSFNSVNSGSNTPYLAVTYTVDPIGLENFWGFTKDGVNPANGNLVLQETDLSIPGRGIPVSLDRTYNSRSSETGIFGYGWTSNLEARLIDAGSGPITFVDGDGTPHYFGQSTSGGYYAYGGIYLTMVKNGDNTYTITQTDGTKINFNTSGKVVSIVDTNGNTTGLTYNGSGKLTTVTDASGRATSITYGTNGYVSGVTDPANRTTFYNYDTNGNLTSVTDFSSKTHSFGYDSNHNLTSTTDPNSTTATIQYDTSDRLTQISRPITIDGTVQTSTTTYVYDTTNSVTEVTDGQGHRVDYTYNANGNIVQTTENPLDPNNQAVTTFAYDNNNNLTQIKDPNTNKANGSQAYVYQYDTNGNITNVQLPQGQQSANTYDSNNNLITAQDFNSNLSSNQYDSKNNKTEATDPNVQTSANRYDTNGNLLNYTPPMSAADNLIPNSSFELDNDANNWPDNWTQETESGTTATFAWSTTAKLGQKSVSVSNPTGWAVVGTDLFPYTTGDKYVISGYVKTVATTGTAVLKLAFYDANNAWIEQQMAYQLKGTNDWTRVQAVVDSVPANTAKIQLTVGLNAGSGTAYFDGVQLEKGTVLSAYNLIDNSSFERDSNADGIPDNWTTSGNLSASDIMDQSTAYIGTNSFKMTGESGKNKYIKQHINVSGDATSSFTLSGWSKQSGANPSGGYYELQVAINNSDGTTDWTNASNFDKTASVWQHVAAQVKPTKAFNSIDVYYYYYNQTGTAWFDAMRLELGASHTFNTYDANGNYVTNVKDPLGNNVAAAYDSDGNQTSTTDAKGQQTSFLYDLMNRLTKVTDAKLGVTTYGYDNAGNQTSVTDANNHASTYSYNEFNKVSAFTNALNQTINFGYDKNGNTTKIIFPKGDTVSYTYNALNRMDGTYYNGVKQWGLGYDANGNLTTVTDGSGNTTSSMTYDSNDRLTQVTEGSDTTGYGYDSNSNLTSVTATGGTTTVSTGYAYNPLNLMVSLSRNGINQAKFVYDERGNVISDNYGNGTYSAYEYDKLNRITSLKNYDAAGNLLDSYAYSYDPNGNVTSIVTNAGTISYQYDQLNQLTQETLLDGTTIAYEYDAVGNRTKKTVNSSTVTNYSYDAGNELTAVNGQAYTYDANGNLTGNGAKTFVYDAENHLTQVKDSGGNTLATYTYDYTGKRTSMTTASGTIYFHYAGDKVIYETDASNNIVADYTWDAQGHPVTMTKNGTTYYYQLNGHGDVVKLTDASGNVVAQYQYDAWGNITSQSGTMASANPYRYAGYRYDEATGLYYLMARYYDATVGRFITRDAVQGFEYEPLSSNMYAYANGNPVMNTDPSGHWSLNIIPVRLAAFALDQLLYWGIGSVATGFLQAYIRRVGVEAAANIFIRTLSSKLVAWGAKKFAWVLGQAVQAVLWFFDPGTWIANRIDQIDPQPHNGWITI